MLGFRRESGAVVVCFHRLVVELVVPGEVCIESFALEYPIKKATSRGALAGGCHEAWDAAARDSQATLRKPRGASGAPTAGGVDSDRGHLVRQAPGDELMGVVASDGLHDEVTVHGDGMIPF